MGCNQGYHVAFYRTCRVLVGFAVLLLCLSSSLLADPAASSGDSPSGIFNVTGHSYAGDILLVNYDIRYPGMTKVKLFDEEGHLVWRGQYVNDKEGSQQLKLRANLLEPGAYRFEFDYKGAVIPYTFQR
jgi:hypothetical protein